MPEQKCHTEPPGPPRPLEPARWADEVPGLLRYARSIVRDPALAEDLVQDTLARALDRQATFRGDSSLATWLHRILHNLAVDRLRRTREDPSDDVLALVEAKWRDETYTVEPAAVAARTETVEEVRDALLRLPFTYRTAVVLHDMQELTVPEIARIQQVTLAAAKQRVRRGRMMLVTALAQGAERRVARRGVPLTCWEARSLVSDYLDDQLPGPDRRMLEVHLERCPTCPPLYAALVDARDAVGRLRDSDAVISPSLAERITRSTIV